MRNAAWLLSSMLACGSAPPPASTAPAASAPLATTATVTEGTGGPAQPRAASPIVARLSVTNAQVARDADVEVSVHIENRGSDPIVLLAEELRAPAALFEIRDGMGQKVLPTSPPMPSGEKRVVEPGKSIAIKMTLAGMFSPPLKPGDYSVRLRRIDSDPRPFRIR